MNDRSTLLLEHYLRWRGERTDVEYVRILHLAARS